MRLETAVHELHYTGMNERFVRVPYLSE